MWGKSDFIIKCTHIKIETLIREKSLEISSAEDGVKHAFLIEQELQARS